MIARIKYVSSNSGIWKVCTERWTRESNGGFFGKTAILESFGKNLVVRSGCASHRPSSGLVSKRINFC